MRVLVRTRRVGDDRVGQHDVEVVNAETGEQVRGVTSLSFHASSVGNHLTLHIHDFDVELDQEAQVLGGPDGDELIPRRMTSGFIAPVPPPGHKWGQRVDPDTGHCTIVIVPDEISSRERVDRCIRKSYAEEDGDPE